jgi:hypothetical protein
MLGKEEERKKAVPPIVRIEEGALLLAVGEIIGGIHIEDDSRRRVVAVPRQVALQERFGEPVAVLCADAILYAREGGLGG